jgi:protease I
MIIMTATMTKIALLAASGVSESEMTAIARALATDKMRAHVITPETGLIHSWGENTWGHCYPSDAKIEASLGSDYDRLIIPGGQRHVDKLMANPHTRRFVTAMFAMNKPVVVFAEAEAVLVSNGFSGDNACVLKYDSDAALYEAAQQMMIHFETMAPLALAEAA